MRRSSSPDIGMKHTYHYDTLSHLTPSIPSPSPDAPNTSLLDPDPLPLATLVSNKSSTTSFRARAHCFPKMCPSLARGRMLAFHPNLHSSITDCPFNSACTHWGKSLLQLSRSLSVLVHAVCHYSRDGSEVVGWSEAAGGDVPLFYSEIGCQPFRIV